MKVRPASESESVHIRMPTKMLRGIKTLAEEERRTQNNMVLVLLEEALLTRRTLARMEK